MLSLFKFTAYNTQAVYGWGDAAEAEAYCDFLNRNREINVYSWAEITDADEIAERTKHEDGVNLEEALQDK